MPKTCVLLLCCAIFVFAAHPQDQSSATKDSDADADQIYSVVVAWRASHPGEGQTPKQLVFMDTTVQYSCLFADNSDCASKVKADLPKRFGDDLDPLLLDDFLARNRDTGRLSQTISTDLPKIWMSRAEEDALFKKHHDGWADFYKKYPGAGGIMSFSRVGFNERRDPALLYSTIGCGWLCGTGHYLLLKKDGGKWVLLKNAMAWIS
jgi:hypothetical protein